VYEAVIDELGAAQPDALQDAPGKVHRTVQAALVAVLASRGVAGLTSGEQAAIINDVDAVLRPGPGSGPSWAARVRPPGGPVVATLGMRVRTHVENVVAACGLASHLDIDEQPTHMPSLAEEGMLRLGYQAIRHACKQAGASNLWVTVHPHGPTVIRVEDDGTGPVNKHGHGYRWRALNSIATQHNVYLAIAARNTRGTIIEITAA
jgi:hypothetical protein